MKVGGKIVQILLLILLLVGGAVAVWWQQGGDLAAITDPVTALLFGEKPEAPTFASSEPAKPAIPPIPDQPAKGLVLSETFTVQSADIRNGVLTLRQGTEPQATELKFHLSTSPWEVPAGKNFQFVNAAAAPATPVVRMRWFDMKEKAPRERQYTDKYTMRIELGKEQDRKVPGKIYLALNDEHRTQLIGTFTAEVRGFRFVDGKPDLTTDSVDTLQYLALRELLKDDPDKAVKDVDFRRSLLDQATQDGYIEMAYRVGDSPSLMTQKFQFVKENNDWRVRGTLKPHQLHEAHPLKAPTAKDAPEQLFPYLAAQRLEAPFAKQPTPPLLTTTAFVTRYSDAHKIGAADVSYQVGDAQPVQKTFLYQREKTGWLLKRELTANERLNLATGKIEKAKPEKK